MFCRVYFCSEVVEMMVASTRRMVICVGSVGTFLGVGRGVCLGVWVFLVVGS